MKSVSQCIDVLLRAILCCSFILTGKSACAQSAAIAHYDVTYVSPKLFEVRATFSQPSTDFGLYFFPSPQRPEGQAASIVDLTAHDSTGKPIRITYVGKGDWKVTGDGAST